MLTQHKLTRERMSVLAAEIEKALQDVAERHGLQSLRPEGGSFDRDGNRGTFKLVAVVKGGLRAEEAAYDTFRREVRPTLPERGTPIVHGGVNYIVFGMKARGRSILILNPSNNKVYGLPITDVEAGAARAAAK